MFSQTISRDRSVLVSNSLYNKSNSSVYPSIVDGLCRECVSSSRFRHILHFSLPSSVSTNSRSTILVNLILLKRLTEKRVVWDKYRRASVIPVTLYTPTCHTLCLESFILIGIPGVAFPLEVIWSSLLTYG